MSRIEWQPERDGEEWVVILPESPLFAKVIRLDWQTGKPLRFWNEESAQSHADSLNCKFTSI